MRGTLVLAVAVLVAFAGTTRAGQLTPPGPEPSPSAVARQLADRQLVVDVPAKGKAKAVFKKGAQTYPLPGGESPAVLLRLPPYTVPYTLNVRSNRHGIGRTTEIFVPSLMFLDETYAVLDSFGVDETPGVSTGDVLYPTDWIYKDFTVDERAPNVRFVLVFTRLDAAGERLDGAAGLASALIGAKVERSADGVVEFTAKPIKAKK